jgi:hypothetical protein
MVGAAVAVATGVFPLEFLRACMAIPTRVRLPRAPPHTLVLTNAQFDHARLPSGAVVPDHLPPVLQLAEAGEAARQYVHPLSLPTHRMHAVSLRTRSLCVLISGRLSHRSLSTSRRDAHLPVSLSPLLSIAIHLVEWVSRIRSVSS